MKSLKLLIFSLIFLSVLTQAQDQNKDKENKKYQYLTAQQIASLGPLVKYDDKVDLSIQCNTKLLQAFHLFGRTTAIPTSLEFCPEVEMSCCTKADQVTIYNNWFTEGEKSNLDRKIEKTEATLRKFFDEAEMVNSWAAKVITNMEGLPNNECKLMARRLLTYQIPDMEDSLMKKFKEMFNFARQTFEGIYCTICDARNHQFFDVGAKKLKVSEQFCRSVITNNLSQLMYYKIHIPKFANLLSTFIGTCDPTGKFVQERIPEEVMHEIKEDEEDSLKQCFEARNTPLWLNECQEICQDWNLDSLSDDFLPELDKLTAIIQFIDEAESNWDPSKKAFGRLLDDNESIKSTKKLQRSYIRRTTSKGSKHDRKLQDPDDLETTNPLIIKYLNNTYPNETDNRGYPLNVTNFTNAGLNKTAVEYVMYVEKDHDVIRGAKVPDEEYENIYISVNKSVGINLMDWSIQVQKNGTDLYREGQFTNIEFDSLLHLIPPEIPLRNLRERKEAALKMNLEEEKEIETAREEINMENERRLKTDKVISAAVLMMSLLAIKLY